MRNLFILILAGLGIKAQAFGEIKRINNCEEKLHFEKNEKAEISNLFIKSLNGNPEELSIREKKIIYELMNKAKPVEMNESHECEITN